MGWFSLKKEYNLADTVAFARKIRATEMTFEVGWPVRLSTPDGPRTIAGFVWSQADYDQRILGRLDAFAREDVRKNGRCEVQVDIGDGKVRAEVEASKARFILGQA